jgi:hypothetical protein
VLTHRVLLFLHSFSIDGVHWACDAAAHAAAARSGGPFGCRSLGHSVAATTIANLMCNDVI